jgi:hypothetical protein
VLPLDGGRALTRPERAQDRDRLLERVNRLLRCSSWTAHRLDRFPEGPGADPELDPSAAQQVQRRGRLGDDRRQTQGQVEDVGDEAHPLGPSRDKGQERPGVEEAALVGMILDRYVVEPGLVRRDRLGDRPLVLLGTGDEKDADLGH